MTFQQTSSIQVQSLGADAYGWTNQYGGSWNSAPNWLDITAGLVAGSAPGAGNAVTIAGGINGNFTNIVGAGAAAQLSLSNDVLLWGAIDIGGTVTLGAAGDLNLDGGASLSAASLNIGNGASMQAGGGSTIAVSGLASVTAGFLTAIDGSALQVGGLIANGIDMGFGLAPSIIAVDGNSSVEVGHAGGSATGAITIDQGAAAAITGAVYGNLIVNGVLGVQAQGTLSIDVGDPFGVASRIAGAGTLTLSEGSVLTLGVADSAAIQFGGPAGTLVANILPSGTITGFVAGDVIDLSGNGTYLATGLSYSQTAASVGTLTFTKGGRPAGTLAIAGNYAGTLFHLNLGTAGDAFVSLQTIGSPPVQPSIVLGTAGSDVLTATANNQTLTGLGGNDTLGSGGFTGIDFKDTSANLNGSTIVSFAASDTIDLTDMNPAAASVSYTPGASPVLMATDGTHTATIGLFFANGLAPGFFTAAADGSGGTAVTYFAANTDSYVFGGTVGGSYAAASQWQDLTTGTIAALAPSYGNAVAIAGGAGAYTDLTGNGFAASVTTSGDVLQWGSLNVGSGLAGVSGSLTQTGTLALDAGAALILAGSASVGGLIEIGGGSTLTGAGGVLFSGSGGALLATGGGSATFGSVLGGGTASSVIGVDSTSSIVFGPGGAVTSGALTIASGVTAGLAGTVNGNVVVNGTLSVSGMLTVAPFGGVMSSVTGGGQIDLTSGGSLAIAGSDSVPVQFTSPASGGTTEMLTFGTTMPTGVISGFAAGDVISTGLIVTKLIYTPFGGSGRLALLEGGTTVGMLALSGTYVGTQFQVQPTDGGLSSAITYASTPVAGPGSAVSGSSDSYSWTNAGGGNWNNAADWIDTTAGATPAAAPGASNAVTIADNTGAWTPQIIAGPAAAASLSISGSANTILMWTMSVAGLFSVSEYGTPSADVALFSGADLSAGSLNVASLLRVASNSLLTVAGSGSGTFISGTLAVGTDSAVRVTGGASTITGAVSVDGTSSVEFGSAGTAAQGTLAIDYGQSVTLQGAAAIEANVVVNGSLLVYSGTIEGFGGTIGSVGGTGTIVIGALGGYGYLILNAADTAAIDFRDYLVNGVAYAVEHLELRNTPRTGIISGFIAGDTIAIDANVTGASFAQTSSTAGTLTLTDGGTAVGTLTFDGNFAGSVFQVDVAPGTGVATISLQASPAPAGAAAPAGTNGQTYAWTAMGGGSWTTAANWAGAATATVPGGGDVVSIAGSTVAGQYTTVTGNGAAVDLTVTGNVMLTGQVNVAASVHVSTGSGPAADLALQAGAVVTAAGSGEVFGRMELGGGSSMTFPGYAFLYGGSMLVLSGSAVRAGGLIGDSAGDILAVDANSTLQIGGAAPAVAGTVSIGAGAPAEFSGQIYGSVVSNGALWVSGGGTLFIDMNGTAESDPYATATPTIGGSGSLVLAENSTLGLGVADSAAIQFAGPDATLILAAIPSATITGFATGDQIQLDQTITVMTYNQTGGNAATLTLSDGTATVGVLHLAGAYGGANAFHLDTAPNGNTAVITLQSLQAGPPQMSMIQGTVGSDHLTATANGQTISGEGGSDVMSAGTFSGIDFRDYTAYLNGSSILDFASSDQIDFIDMNPAAATAHYSAGMLTVTDGSHIAAMGFSFANTAASGSFHLTSDGASGTRLTWS